jgi:exosome complex exonuclease RRP6
VELAVDEQRSGLTKQIDIPYIPAAQRQPADKIDDFIVVVGQARQKKRKRAKASAAQVVESETISPSAMDVDISTGANPTKNPDNRRDEDDSPFDFSTVPNILDDVPTPEPDPTVRNKKKQKKSKGKFGFLPPCLWADYLTGQLPGGVMEYGSFPAPPKAHRELKSGNRSYTFK